MANSISGNRSNLLLYVIKMRLVDNMWKTSVPIVRGHLALWAMLPPVFVNYLVICIFILEITENALEIMLFFTQNVSL